MARPFHGIARAVLPDLAELKTPLALRAPNNRVVVVVTLAKPLERFPIRWNHLIEKESLRFKELERVLMRHQIYPMSKYRKSRSTFSEHALARIAWAVLTRGGTCVAAGEATAA